MIVFCWVLLVFLAMVFFVATVNCVNANVKDRGVEIIVSVAMFCMMVGIVLLMNFLKNGG